MHKGYKCLDRSTGRIFISRDVVFDEKVFLFSTPGVSVDVSALEQAITFPSDEPITSAPMRNYDLSFLTANPPSSGDGFSVQVPAAGIAGTYVQNDSVSSSHDMHGRSMHVPLPEASLPGAASSGVASPEATSTEVSSSLPVAQTGPVIFALAVSAVGSPVLTHALPESLPHGDLEQPPVSPPPCFAMTSPAVDIVPVHPMVTRHRDNTRRDKTYSDGTVRYDSRRRAFFAAP
jgi:hypothetical protein